MLRLSLPVLGRAGAVNSLFADGSVHTIDDSIDLTLWQTLGSSSNGESIGEGW